MSVPHKTCRACGEVKPLDAFYRNKAMKDGHEARCKTCRNVYLVAYQKANPDKVKVWREINYERHKEKRVATATRWRINNPGRAKVNHHRSRIAWRGDDHVTVEQWNAVLEKYGGKCLRCGTTEKIVIDHVVPLSMGGLNEVHNIQPLCKSCNLKKRGQTTDYRPA